MDTVIARVQNREWVEPQLAAAVPVAEFAAPVDDTYAVLRLGGLHHAMTSIDPRRQLLDDLTGIPEVAGSHTTIWRTTGTDLQHLSVLLRQCLEQDLPRRDRLDVRSYRALMGHNVEALTGRAEKAMAMAVITQAAGELILQTRDNLAHPRLVTALTTSITTLSLTVDGQLRRVLDTWTRRIRIRVVSDGPRRRWRRPRRSRHETPSAHRPRVRRWRAGTRKAGHSAPGLPAACGALETLGEQLVAFQGI